MQQLALRNVEEMDLAPCAKFPGTRAIVFSLFASPETKVEYHVDSQDQSPARHVPLQGFKGPVPSIVLWIFCILPKETDVPFIDSQSKCGVLLFERSSQGRLAGTGKPDHQMESRQV